jgi:serine/threonine protein kinase
VAEPEQPWIVGKTYRVGELLGRGAMGEVFAAEGPDGSQVALKILHAALSSRDDVIERFKREAEIAALVRCDYVAAVLGAGKDRSGRLWIAFERLDGEPLDRVLASAGRLPTADVRYILGDTLRALKVAHPQRVVHRDIKPSNTFLERRSPPRARLLDFGVSKIRASPSANTVSGGLTDVGDSLGTFSFMPPEQIGDSKNVDERADLYAAGVLAFVALTGVLPFRGSTSEAVLQAKLDRSCPLLSLRDVTGVKWPEITEGFFSQMMAYDRGDRFQSASAALAAW